MNGPGHTELAFGRDDVDEQYEGRFAALSDDELFDVTGRIVAVPKRDPADSFILHAPLELLARRALLEIALPEGHQHPDESRT